MTTDGVHGNEMSPYASFDDDLWPAGDPALASFAEDLRIVASGPAPEPRPGLVAAMRQGAPVPSDPSAGRNNKMLVKTFLGSLAAKLALGVGVAAASVTAAGAAGVLPDAAQHAIASVVSATTPFDLPDPGVSLQVAGDTSSSTSSTSTTVAADKNDDQNEAGTTATTEPKVNHGTCVSAAAQDKSASEGADPNSHGKTVSSIARSDCGKTEGSTTTSTSSTTSTTTLLGTANAGPSTNGKGNSGNGGGNGNGGKGNSGKN